MTSEARVLVLPKNDVTKSTVVPVSLSSLSALAGGSIRVRVRIVGITANTLTYARFGARNKWWDAYPVPPQLPAPYNDQTEYGICPCWGYSEIIESKVPGLEMGTMIQGFWPMGTDLPFDLKLAADENVPNHWLEVTEYRQTMMPLYNRYIVRDATLRWGKMDRTTMDDLAWQSLIGTVWQCGFLMYKFVFAPPYVHPCGEEAIPGQTWSETKGDLSEAVVVNLSAGGKTARSFTDGLLNEMERGRGPLGLLAITGSDDSGLIPRTALPTKTIGYEAITEASTMEWLAQQKPKKVVICDFGGRGDSFSITVSAVEKHLPGVEIVSIGIGMEAKPMSMQEFGAWAQKNMGAGGRVQMNTSPAREAMMAHLGAEAYFKDADEGWRAFVKRDGLKGLKLVWGEGVEGKHGVEGGWESVCQGVVSADAGQAYKL